MDEVALLKDLVSRYSPTGEESKAVAFLVEEMQKAGFKAFVDSTGNAVGILGDGPNEIVLLGHIDTVQGEIPVRIEGDLLFGRGTVDAKGPLACLTAAAAQAGPQPGWKIIVIGALAEEGDSRGAKGILHTYHPHFAVIGEPSGWDRITLGYKGSAWIRYRVEKPMSHSASGKQTACETAVQFWNRLVKQTHQWNASTTRVFDQVTPSLRSMHSEQNGFVDTAELEINVRLPPAMPPERLMQEILFLDDEGTVNLLDGIPAYRGEKNSPLVRALLQAIRSEGGNPTFSLKTGTADLNLVAPVWSCPCVAYGPGDSNLDHTPNEHISLSEYRQSIRVLTQTLKTITQGAS